MKIVQPLEAPVDQNLEEGVLKTTQKIEQVRDVFLVLQSLAVCVVCVPNLRCMSLVATDQVQSIDEEGGQVEGIGHVLETEVFC